MNKIPPNSLLKLRSSPVDQSEMKNSIQIPKYEIPPNLKNISQIKLISKSIGDWDPSRQLKCMICWKPIDIYGKDAGSYMECRHCHEKAHQDHMLRWLAKKDYCPYCRGKW